jgi:hypothetical protein
VHRTQIIEKKKKKEKDFRDFLSFPSFPSLISLANISHELRQRQREGSNSVAKVEILLKFQGEAPNKLFGYWSHST